MDRSLFALFMALLIHLVLLMLFWILGSISEESDKSMQAKEKRMKVSLKEMPKKADDSGLSKQKSKKEEKVPPMPKGKQLEHIVEPSKIVPVKYDPMKTKQKFKNNKPPETTTVDKKTQKTKSLPDNNSYITLPKKNNAKKYESYDWLLEDKSAQEVKEDKKIVKNGSNINNDIMELYGSDFDNLTVGQQQYILDNQEIMRRITQEVLNRVASVNLTEDLNINRVNVVEFYLHPNGDITDFKFKKVSGYYILDKTTRETIEYAYSKYPRPTEKTLIRYNVYYNLARY